MSIMNKVKNLTGQTQVVASNVKRVLQNKSTLINLNLISTNLCNQHCPMCNTTLMRDQKSEFTLELFDTYIEKLKEYNLASCTISGGEPTLVKEIPLIIEKAPKYFPMGVLVISNFYGNTKRIEETIRAALSNDVNLSVSFDGFGTEADKLRGSKNVSERVLKHLELLYNIQQNMQSRSVITIHTVVADMNLSQLPKIFGLSKQYGWKHTIAPVNNFYYQGNDFVSGITPTQELKEMCELALEEKHVDMRESYIKGIFLYAEKKAPKLCPFTTNHFRTYKFFLEPNGDISLCDREAIGNLNENHIDEMLASKQYKKSLQAFKDCEGCWLNCFVEPTLRLNPFINKKITSQYDKNTKNIQHQSSIHSEDLLPVLSSSKEKELAYSKSSEESISIH